MKDYLFGPNDSASTPSEPSASKRQHSREFNRRHFLRATLFGSAALFVPVDLLEALEPGNAALGYQVSPATAAFHSLVSRAVRAEGLLDRRRHPPCSGHRR
jgi:hypothetical protein